MSDDSAPTAFDRRGLIREAYRIEGLSPANCRSIFLDWAMGPDPGENPRAAIAALLAHYRPGREDHPMTQVLEQGLQRAAPAGRRGGRKGRRRR